MIHLKSMALHVLNATRPRLRSFGLVGTIWTLAAIAAFCPFRAAAHLAPALVVVGFLLGSGAVERRTLLKRLALLAGAVTAWALVTHTFSPSVTLQSTALWALTWSAVVVLLLPVSRDRVLTALPKIESLALWLVGLQGLWGLVQIVYGGLRTGTLDSKTGDYFDGFVHPALAAADTFANPTFSAGFVVLLLVCLGACLRGRGLRFILGAGIAAGVLSLASVMHQVAFLAIALATATALVTLAKRTRAYIAPVIAVLAVLLSITVVLHPRNVRSGAAQANTIAASFPATETEGFDFTMEEIEGVDTAGPPKPASSIADKYAAMSRLERDRLSGLVYGNPNAKVTLARGIYGEGHKNLGALVLGWGPGTFASRAAAIRTGAYFGGPENPQTLPGLRTEVTPLFEKHLIHPWFWAVFSNANFGSTHKPFSSWMSALSETGLLGIVVLGILGWLTLKCLALSAPYPWSTLTLLSAAGFLFLLGFQEHYWEMPQIATLQLLTIRMYFAIARPSS